MNQVSVRNLFVAASALLFAFAPIRSAYADETAASAGTGRTAGIVEAVEAARLFPFAQAVETVRGAAESAMLRPGEFVWQPERSPLGEVEMVVSIPLQRAYVYRGGTLIGVSTVSTGRKGHATPVGRFDILQKTRRHFSNLYNNAPMPYRQRLTWDGIALHAGQIPGHPASHGCVRLPLEFAKLLFGATRIGASVHIIDKSPAPAEALARVRGADRHAGMGGPLEEVQSGTD